MSGHSLVKVKEYGRGDKESFHIIHIRFIERLPNWTIGGGVGRSGSLRIPKISRQHLNRTQLYQPHTHPHGCCTELVSSPAHDVSVIVMLRKVVYRNTYVSFLFLVLIRSMYVGRYVGVGKVAFPYV